MSKPTSVSRLSQFTRKASRDARAAGPWSWVPDLVAIAGLVAVLAIVVAALA